MKKFKKLGIAISILLIMLLHGNVANAWLQPQKEEPKKPWMVECYVSDNQTTVIELEAITKFMLRTPTKRVIENPVLASQMTNKESYISKTDFEQLLEGFFDWLVLQGIM